MNRFLPLYGPRPHPKFILGEKERSEIPQQNAREDDFSNAICSCSFSLSFKFRFEFSMSSSFDDCIVFGLG